MPQVQQFITSGELDSFEKLLNGVQVNLLSATPYAKRYLQHIIDHKKYYLHIYARLLDLAVQTPPNVTDPSSALKKHPDRNDLSLIDYGAGNGVMGLLAKYCGFGKVYLNDISEDFLEAAKQLAVQMNIPVDGFIEGDIDKVRDYFATAVPDVLVSTDVIEHIYDLPIFFTTAKKINPGMVTVMSTACNPANYLKVREFKKIQLKDELQGGEPGDHVLFGQDPIEPFIKIRQRIITAYAAGRLTSEAINKLATFTRGLRKDDIEKAVQSYMVHTTWPPLPSHPTNTCDPVTGSWSERLLSFDEYRTIYAAAGYQVQFYDGFYNGYEDSLKSKMLSLANKLIPVSGHRLSPFIILVGT